MTIFNQRYESASRTLPCYNKFVAYINHLGKKCKMQAFEYLKKAVNNILSVLVTSSATLAHCQSRLLFVREG
jgi:hypothetical protein